MRACAAAAGLILSAACFAQTPEVENWNARFQATYVGQDKPSFPAPYSGPHSLSPEREKSYSFTATAFLGLRPWTGGELYVNPEAVQGVPLSGLAGLGGFTNGEIQKTAGPKMKFYRARLYWKQTWGFGGDRESVESDQNQLGGWRETRRLVTTLGNLAVVDLFDNNAYAHDPRTDFLNWSVTTHGAFDYAADARGYTWGGAIEWYYDEWAIRAGRFMQPEEPNQQPLDTRILRHYGDQVELEHAHRIAGRPGKLRLLLFRNRARMSRYRDAIDLAMESGAVPDINLVRNADRTKIGFGLNLEQALSADIGLFSRASWADGKTETYAFTEIDRSLSAGISSRGARWGRSHDKLGLAFVRNALSRDHRDYLAAGGLGFFLGDGRLDYRPEAILETFYRAELLKGTSLSLDLQRIRNPAYNADRGPVHAGSVRLHVEF